MNKVTLGNSYWTRRRLSSIRYSKYNILRVKISHKLIAFRDWLSYLLSFMNKEITYPSPATHFPSSVNSISVSPANPYPYPFVDESRLSPSFVLSSNERNHSKGLSLFSSKRSGGVLIRGITPCWKKIVKWHGNFIRNGNVALSVSRIRPSRWSLAVDISNPFPLLSSTVELLRHPSVLASGVQDSVS